MLLLLLLPTGVQCSTAQTGKRITSGFCSEAEAAEHGYDPVSAACSWLVLGRAGLRWRLSGCALQRLD